MTCGDETEIDSDHNASASTGSLSLGVDVGQCEGEVKNTFGNLHRPSVFSVTPDIHTYQ